MELKGRRTIYTSETDLNSLDKVISVLNYAIKIHQENVIEMDYLIDYYLGKQPILNKVKTVRADINNKVVINFANAAVRDVKGYTFGQPLTYISRNQKNVDELGTLNDANEFENKSTIDNDVAEYMLITGLGFRAVFPEDVVSPDEQPFKYACLDPRNAFIVRETKVGNKPVMAVIIEKEILPIESLPGTKTSIIYNVYTRTKRYMFKVPGDGISGGLTVTNYVSPAEGGYADLQVLNTLPIEEFSANLWKLGFFETVLSVLDSLNLVASDTLDDIEQKIRSKLILLGIDPLQLEEKTVDEKGETISTFADSIRNSEVLAFTGQQGINQDAKFVSSTLEYIGVGEYRDWLESMYYYLLGLPERRTRGNGGGDTGHAVELRDGWASLETVARNIENRWRASEREGMKRTLEILRVKKKIKSLKLTDIDVQFSRNKLSNLQSKVQAGQIMAQMNMYDPVDITTLMDITTDPQGMVDRGAKYIASHPVEDKKDIKPEEKPAEGAQKVDIKRG